MVTPCYIAESWGQEASWGDQSRDRVPYIIRGPKTRDVALTMVATYAGARTPSGRYLRSYDVREIGPGIWHGEAEYTTVPPPSESEWNFEFDTSAATVHIRNSRKTIAKYTRDGKFDGDMNQAIGVQDGTIEGCDIVEPKFDWSEQHQLKATVCTFAYAMTLYNLTGTTNKAAFRGFPAKSVLFLGAQCRRSSKDPKLVDASFKFRAAPAQTGLKIGDIKNIDKGPWEYLWTVYWKSEGTADMPIVQRAQAVYIEQVYDEGDFSLLQIGTGAP